MFRSKWRALREEDEHTLLKLYKKESPFLYEILLSSPINLMINECTSRNAFSPNTADTRFTNTVTTSAQSKSKSPPIHRKNYYVSQL